MRMFGLSPRDLMPILCAALLIAGLGAAAAGGIIEVPLPPLSMAALLP